MKIDIRAVLLKVISEQQPKDPTEAANLQSTSVLNEAAASLGGAHDHATQQALLTGFHDLFRTGYLAWGFNLAFFASIIVFLTACDNGSNSTVLTGHFIDSPVGGVDWRTDSRTGTTDADGRFVYLAGESVTFSIGDTVLGSAVAKPEISPFDIVADARAITGTKEITDALRRPNEGESVPPFQIVLNLITLLQTLDGDGDPANGIEITARVADLFTGLDMDLVQGWEAFANGDDFRDLLVRANDQQLLDYERGPRPPWLSLAHLYETLELDPGIRVRTRLTSVGSQNYIRTEVYDDNGYLIHQETDSSGSIYADGIDSYEYDERGNNTTRATDYDGDGQTDWISTYQYDAWDREIRFENDIDLDAIADYIVTTEYDVDGNRVAWMIDENGDEITDRKVTYEYDENDKVTLEQEVDGDGTLVFSNRLYYDENGNLVRREYQQFGDVVDHWINTYEYDNAGNRTWFRDDQDGDGIFEESTAYEYDADHNLIQITDYAGDENVPVKTDTLMYDADGNLIEYAYDISDDGTAFYRSTYEYDVNGNRTRHTFDRRDDGTPEKIEQWMYDKNGNLVRYEKDTDNDGLPNHLTIYEYDEYGFRTSVTQDTDGDGDVDEFTSSEYSATGWAGVFDVLPFIGVGGVSN